MPKPKNLKVNRKRNYSPHHMLIGAARMALEDAKEKKPGYFYNYLITITFSALSLEALGNAFGKRLIDRWKDFESSGPIAKLRIICEHLDIKANFKEDPWLATIWLIKMRNKIAHAKPQKIDINLVRSRSLYDDEEIRTRPEAKLEKEITLDNAVKAFKTAEKIKNILCDRTPSEELSGLSSDMWFGSASPLEND